MDLREIIIAVRSKIEYVTASAKPHKQDIIDGSDIFNADFEVLICDYVDAINEVKTLKSYRKRQIIVYLAMGHTQDEIADKLHISQPAVSQNISWLKRFFNKELI